MFWGLIVEPGKRYTQQVAKSFHISMACLEVNNKDEKVSLMLDYDGQEFILCTLHEQKSLQSQLDLNFQTGEQVVFYSSGKGRIHLSGYLADDLDLSDEDDDDDEEEEESSIQEMPRKRKDTEPNKNKASKKQKLQPPDVEEEVEDDDDDEFEEPDTSDDNSEEEVEEESDAEIEEEESLMQRIRNTSAKKGKNQSSGNLDKSQQNKTPNQQKKSIVKTPTTPTQNGETPQSLKKKKKNKNKNQSDLNISANSPLNTPKSKVMTGGVVVADVQVGNGPAVKPGDKVGVYYVGRLKQNKKQFDASTTGPGFKFTLGHGEVIKGWDVGVAGMKVGGKRTITIPPAMAYGKRGQPPVIPPESTLVFDVELKSIN